MVIFFLFFFFFAFVVTVFLIVMTFFYLLWNFFCCDFSFCCCCSNCTPRYNIGQKVSFANAKKKWACNFQNTETNFAINYWHYQVINLFIRNVKLENVALNPLNANATKWSNTFKQFVGNKRHIVWVCLIILWGWRLKV